MEALLQDLRYALRSLVKTPLLAGVVVASLALGIGANTTIFSLANVLLLRPVSTDRPDRLAAVFTSESNGERFGTSSHPDFLDLRERNEAFEDLAAYSIAPLSLTMGGTSQRVLGTLCSGNYLTLLGIRPALGRTLLPADDEPGAAPAAFLSHAFWTRRLSADPAAVGKPLIVNGHPFTVVGVAPEGFRGAMMGLTPDLFVPFATHRFSQPGEQLDQRGHRGLLLLGRLAPGASMEQAEARANLVMTELAREHPADSGRVVSVIPEAEARVFPRIRGPVVAFIALLMVVVALVLAVACANVAGLMLARAAARRREIALRAALGASRGRIVRQLLTESLLLGLAGGAVGLLLAQWGTELLLAFKPPLPVDVVLDLRPDGRVLAFTAALSIGTGLLFGVVPALQGTRAALTPALAETPGGGMQRSRTRSILVVVQVALSVLLLLGAGLVLRGLGQAHRLDPGFDVSHSLALSFDLDLQGYPEERGIAFYRELLDRVRALPGVRAAAMSENLPLGLGWRTSGIAIEGVQSPETLEIPNDAVSADYFETLRIPIVRGRSFRADDRAGSPPVVIVNQAFARRFWPGQDPVGRRMSLDSSGGGGWMDVVGVAQDIPYRSLGEEPRPYFYLCAAQAYGNDMTLVVRTAGNPAAAIAPIRSIVRSLDPKLPVFDVKTMTEHLGISLMPARLASSVLGSFGALALLLAAIGLYGVVAFGVSQRTREIGVRMALGARPADVLGLVVGGGVRLAAIGVAIGLAAGLALTRTLAGLLFGVSPTDPATFAGILAVLGGTLLVASWIPARRAARVEPMRALRHE